MLRTPIVDNRTKPLKIFVLAANPSSLTWFRAPLIKAFVAAGHEVVAGASAYDEKTAKTLESWGVRYEALPLARNGMNPFADVKTIASLANVLRRSRPDIVFAYTIKPVIYGTLAAWMARVPRRYAMITGLGYAFTPGSGLKKKIARMVASAGYWLSLKLVDTVIVQNTDDLEFVVSQGWVERGRVARVNGSGVDIKHFSPTPLPTGAPRFLLIARLLRDKGIYEFVEAARIVRASHPEARFMLVGPYDPGPNGIKPEEVKQWEKDGAIEYHGEMADVRPMITECTVYVLPSYREGMPRTVLEAMAMGRAVITTDAAGCRDAVVDAVNGFLVPVGQASPIAEKALRFLDDPSLAHKMGQASEERARNLYEADVVALSVLDIMRLPHGEVLRNKQTAFENPRAD